MKLNPEDITRILKAQIQQYEKKVKLTEIGTVLTVGDGIAQVYGLDACVSNELLAFPENVFGMALNLDKDKVTVVLLGDDSLIHEGDVVKRTGKVVSVPVGEALLGRVVDALGAPLDGKGPISVHDYYPIERPAAGIIERERVSVPLQTGIKAIDSMIPIGRGQRELIIGDRQTGKTTIAIDTIINQKNENVICVYVAIGQQQNKLAQVAEKLKQNGALDYTVIVAATAAEPAPLQYIVPYTGCTMAEFFMEQGRDVLIVYDDLSKHAVAYRTLSLLIRRPPGREAYPGDVFYLHSRLLERGVRLSKSHGGGSITALPIIETQAGDISAYIPTNVISITDGQIYLETELFHEGIIPAVNPGISVSRVGGTAQIPAMRKISGRLKLLYSQYNELASFAQFGSDLDISTRRRLTQGRCIVEALKQSETSPVPVEKQVCLFHAVLSRDFTEIAVDKVQDFEQFLYEQMDEQQKDILTAIRQNGTLSEEEQDTLNNAIERAKKSFINKLSNSI